jgi:hypothetical protein
MKSKFKYGEMFSKLENKLCVFYKMKILQHNLFVLGVKILHKEKDWLW